MIQVVVVVGVHRPRGRGSRAEKVAGWESPATPRLDSTGRERETATEAERGWDRSNSRGTTEDFVVAREKGEREIGDGATGRKMEL